MIEWMLRYGSFKNCHGLCFDLFIFIVSILVFGTICGDGWLACSDGGFIEKMLVVNIRVARFIRF